jgi:uncharacterized SAM-binding protein YcdF (DUF218 family)
LPGRVTACYNRPMIWRLLRGLLVCTALVAVAGAAQLIFLAYRVNRTGSGDQAAQADAIVVLGAQVEVDGQAGPDLRSRTLHAVELFQRGMAPRIVCTGGYEGDRLSAAAVACRLAEANGVPASSVLLAEGSMTTWEDARSAGTLLRAHGWRSAILVSHPLHLERARLLFQDQGIAVFPSPTSTDLDAIPWKDRAWLTAREAVGIAWIGLSELGVPYEWTARLSRWVYDLPPLPGTD